MKNLIEILKKETESLKDQYLKLTAEWAEQEFDRMELRVRWTEQDWCNFLGIVPEERKMYNGTVLLGFPKGFYNSRNARTYHSAFDKAVRIRNLGKEEFLKRQKKAAEDHYEFSIEKLAHRIEKKNLNQTSLQVVTSHIGVNIETTISDGDKVVRAFTIIASGPIQKPHYRYLVK